MRVRDMVWREGDLRDIELDGKIVVKACDKGIEWHLPGGFVTKDYDAVRDYCSAIKRDKLHIKGHQGLEGLKNDIASYTSRD